jgi:hypothetical protein
MEVVHMIDLEGQIQVDMAVHLDMMPSPTINGWLLMI